MFSRPTASRTRPGVTPVASCSSAVSCECVVDAGWITRLRTSPMLATWLCSSSASTNALAGLDAAVDLEGEHAADAAAGRTSAPARATGCDGRPA